MACQCPKHGLRGLVFISKDLQEKVNNEEKISDFIKFSYEINGEHVYSVVISNMYKLANNLTIKDGEVLPLLRNMPAWYNELGAVCSGCLEESLNNNDDVL